MLRPQIIVTTSLLLYALGVVPSSAQSLTLSLFERYLDSLREQAGIPGLSAAVVQGTSIWERGLGKQDIEANVAATADTPYFIGDVSQIMGAAMTLRTCLEQGSLETTDRVVRWLPDYPDPDATIEQLLTHTTGVGAFKYDSDRFAGLTGVIVECADRPYRHVLNDEVFERFAMSNSSPGLDVGGPAAPGGVQFPAATVLRFADVARRAARSYRVDRGKLVRSEVLPAALSASTGLMASVHDLVAFDVALSTGAILQGPQLQASWTQAVRNGVALPTGFGWFVQNYNGEAVVWQFGHVKDGHSALIVKVPGRGLSFIALANTDGLTAGYNLANGDVTASPFASLFLRFFVP